MSLISGLLGHSAETSAEDAAAKLKHALIEGEQLIKAYKLVRDQVLLTNLRIIWVNKQGVTGRKQEIMSIPYRSIDRFSMENAGLLDLDSELAVWIKGVDSAIVWKFSKGANIDEAHRIVAQYVLA